MSKCLRGLGLVGLVALGYLLGAAGVGAPNRAQAQGKPKVEGISDDTANKIKAAVEALAAAGQALQGESKHVPATTAINASAIIAGGVNALDDLESGRGVDPETFAALYAGLAVDEIKAKLAKDDEGRLTYDGKVVKLYPVSKLKIMYMERDRMLGIKLPGKPAN